MSNSVLTKREARPPAGAWIYERRGGRGDDRFVGSLMIAGAVGASALVVQFCWQRMA